MNFADLNMETIEHTSAVMAIQHLLVKKGICSFAELSDAALEAKKILGRTADVFLKEEVDGKVQPLTDDDVDAFIDNLVLAARFVGGDDAAADVINQAPLIKDSFKKEMSSQ